MEQLTNQPSVEILHVDYNCHYKNHKSPKRKNNYYYIRFQVLGKCKVLVENDELHIGAGEWLIIRPQETAQVVFESSDNGHSKELISSNYSISCTGVWFDHWLKANSHLRHVKIPLSESLLSMFREMTLAHRKKMESQDQVSKEIANYIFQAICCMIERASNELTANELSMLNGNDYRLFAQKMKEFVVENATQPFRLEDVARDAGFSVSRAVYLFKSAFGQTIMQYAIEVRLSIACEYIKFSDMTLENIAEASGFGSYAYFHRVFRSKYSISPKQYRVRYLDDYNTRQ